MGSLLLALTRRNMHVPLAFMQLKQGATQGCLYLTLVIDE
jgi:hypothetical protein